MINVKHIQGCGNHSLLFGRICGEVFMLVSELCSIGSSGASKGFKQDQRDAKKIKRREVRRKNNTEASEFAALVMKFCPGYYEDMK